MMRKKSASTDPPKKGFFGRRLSKAPSGATPGQPPGGTELPAANKAEISQSDLNSLMNRNGGGGGDGDASSMARAGVVRETTTPTQAETTGELTEPDLTGTFSVTIERGNPAASLGLQVCVRQSTLPQ
jgi:hypothetical protein